MRIKRGVFPPLSNNCYLLLDENTNEAALVDCSVWNGNMERLIGNVDLKYILLTHGHYDHTGGVAEVKKHYGAKVVIAAPDAPMLTSAVKSLAFITGNTFSKSEADILVREGDTLQVGGITIKVLATPGHTKGGVCYLAERALFTGDTLFYTSCGRTDFPGGSAEEMLNSLCRLKALEGDYEVYPGHEDVTNLAFERKNNPYMNT